MSKNLLIDELFPEGYFISTDLKKISFLCKRYLMNHGKKKK